jgi:hypothetical protein
MKSFFVDKIGGSFSRKRDEMAIFIPLNTSPKETTACI